MLNFQPERLVRSNLLNLKKDGYLINFPLYAISVLPSVIGRMSKPGTSRS